MFQAVLGLQHTLEQPTTHRRPSQTAHDLDYETWARTLTVNSIGPVRVLLALLPNLKNGKDKKAVAITSGMGSTTNHDGSALIYRSSKAALNNAMHGLALALKTDGIVLLEGFQALVLARQRRHGGAWGRPHGTGTERQRSQKG